MQFSKIVKQIPKSDRFQEIGDEEERDVSPSSTLAFDSCEQADPTTTILCSEMQVKREDENLQAFYNMTFCISKESNDEKILLPKPS